MSDESAVLAAADACIGAFGRHDRDAYFATFAPDATFIFHTTPTVLASRAEWEREWDRLVAEDGFRVLACESHDRRVQMLAPGAAVFSHRVLTRSTSRDGGLETDERETIVFQRQPDGSWLAVHEHLSPTPDAGALS
jgi:ketosteroid isomerase-like protein